MTSRNLPTLAGNYGLLRCFLVTLKAATCSDFLGRLRGRDLCTCFVGILNATTCNMLSGHVQGHYFERCIGPFCGPLFVKMIFWTFSDVYDLVTCCSAVFLRWVLSSGLH